MEKYNQSKMEGGVRVITFKNEEYGRRCWDETDSIQLCREMLDIKLKDNDKNIIDMIMSYVVENCDICGCKSIDELNEVDDYDLQCMTDCEEEEPEYICDDCKRTDFCYSCDKHLCKCREDIYDDGKCSAKDCDRYFCDGCKSESLLGCGSCEGFFCCKKVIRIIGENETIYKCEGCLDDCKVIYPHFS